MAAGKVTLLGWIRDIDCDWLHEPEWVDSTRPRFLLS
jgi:hypothetical protein